MRHWRNDEAPLPSTRHRVNRVIVVLAYVLLGGACRQSGPEVTRISARPGPPTASLPPGVHELGLGRAIYRGMRPGRDTVPSHQDGIRHSGAALVLLHGGGGQARDFDFMFPLAEEFGVALLTLDARHNTWDGVDSPFGPDVLFIDTALRYAFEHALSTRRASGSGPIGRGDVCPDSRDDQWRSVHTPDCRRARVHPRTGTAGRHPRVFLAHGIRDDVYSVSGSRSRLLPQLRGAGYDVTYYEFDGPHFITPPTARVALRWLAGSQSGS